MASYRDYRGQSLSVRAIFSRVEQAVPPPRALPIRRRLTANGRSADARYRGTASDPACPSHTRRHLQRGLSPSCDERTALYRIVESTLPKFEAALQSGERSAPRFVEREFDQLWRFGWVTARSCEVRRFTSTGRESAAASARAAVLAAWSRRLRISSITYSRTYRSASGHSASRTRSGSCLHPSPSRSRAVSR